MFQQLPIIIAFLTSLAAPAGAATIYVANENGRSLSIIDSASGATKQISLPIQPHNVDLTMDGKRILATGTPPRSGAHATHQDAGGQVVVIDREAPEPNARTVEVGGHPAHVIPDAAGNFAYVTDAANDAVIVVDLRDFKVVGRISVGRYPHGLRLSPDGAVIAVANMKSGAVSLVELASRKEIASVEVGHGPVQVAFDGSGRFLAVSLNGENKVAFVDVPARQVLWKADVGREPVQVALAPDASLIYVANQGSSGNPDTRLSIVSVKDRKTIATSTVGRGAHGLAIDWPAMQAFVTNTYANTVSVVDLLTSKVTGTFPTGRGPNGIAFH